MLYYSIRLGKDDPIDVTITDEGVALSAAAAADITGWVFEFNNEVVSSADFPALFSFDTATARLTMKPGSQLTETGEGCATLEFITASDPNGVTVFGCCTDTQLYLTVC